MKLFEFFLKKMGRTTFFRRFFEVYCINTCEYTQHHADELVEHYEMHLLHCLSCYDDKYSRHYKLFCADFWTFCKKGGKIRWFFKSIFLERANHTSVRSDEMMVSMRAIYISHLRVVIRRIHDTGRVFTLILWFCKGGSKNETVFCGYLHGTCESC